MIAAALVALTLDERGTVNPRVVNDLNLITAAALLGDLAAVEGIRIDEKDRVVRRPEIASPDPVLTWAHGALLSASAGKPQNLLLALRAIYKDSVERVGAAPLPDPRPLRDAIIPVLSDLSEPEGEVAVLISLISAGDGINDIFGDELRQVAPDLKARTIAKHADRIAQRCSTGQWALAADAAVQGAQAAILLGTMTTSAAIVPVIL